MRAIQALIVINILTSNSVLFAQEDAPAQNISSPLSDQEVSFIRIHLTHCAVDFGFNEGSREAMEYVNIAVAAGYTEEVGAALGAMNAINNLGSHQLLGPERMLKRPAVIEAAKALVVKDQELAVNLALTCLAQNPPVRAELSSHPAAVAAWLRGEL